MTTVRQGMFGNKQESKAETKPAHSAKLPPQIKKRLNEHGKLIDDNLAVEMKAAIQRIYEKKRKKILSDPAADEKDPVIQEKLKKARYRYYGKVTLAKEMKKKKKAIPYGVELFELESEEKTRDVFCLKMPGMKGRKVKEFKTNDDYLKLEQDIFGVGGIGKVIPLSNMDNVNEVFAVKIKNQVGDETRESLCGQEYEHARRAGLAIAQSIRKSPSHGNRIQQRIIMHFAPGIKLGDVMHHKKLTSLECATIFYNALVALHNSAHQFNAVHRDIKGENFHLDLQTLQCTLLDFGFQAALGEDGVLVDRLKGMPEMLAPEIYQQWQDFHKTHAKEEAVLVNSTFKTDLFALGVVLADIVGQIEPQYFARPENFKLLAKQGGMKLSNNLSKTFAQIFPEKEARDFIYTFLVFLMHDNPAVRLTLDECLEYLKTFCDYLRALQLVDGKPEVHHDLLDAQIREWNKREELAQENEAEPEYGSGFTP